MTPVMVGAEMVTVGPCARLRQVVTVVHMRRVDLEVEAPRWSRVLDLVAALAVLFSVLGVGAAFRAGWTRGWFALGLLVLALVLLERTRRLREDRATIALLAVSVVLAGVPETGPFVVVLVFFAIVIAGLNLGLVPALVGVGTVVVLQAVSMAWLSDSGLESIVLQCSGTLAFFAIAASFGGMLRDLECEGGGHDPGPGAVGGQRAASVRHVHGAGPRPGAGTHPSRQGAA
ncbi:MAG: hypothetical protein V9G19_09685 [Tetrasphaera sp.]